MIRANKHGFFGDFGGAYIPELLNKNIEELKDNYKKIIYSSRFQKEFKKLLQDYVGRPTPLYYAERLSTHFQKTIFLKREDLCHTGAHKINNVIGQSLLAKELKKKKIIAETGAGQHGMATATVCALMGLECLVFMGATDMERQDINVQKMRLLGAQVVRVESGNKTLKDATNEAMRYWIGNPQCHYIIGSTVGPHPYPEMVMLFQSIISKEIKSQLYSHTKKKFPDVILACVGGGSNASGAFYHFIDKKKVRLIGLEAAGKGIYSHQTAATLTMGSKGILHGSKSKVLQTKDGQLIEPYSISAGLDYPGVGPLHAYLQQTKKAHYYPITDEEAIKAGLLCMRLEGIIPAIETAHALAYLEKMNTKRKKIIIVNFSGRGEKDIEIYKEWNKK